MTPQHNHAFRAAIGGSATVIDARFGGAKQEVGNASLSGKSASVTVQLTIIHQTELASEHKALPGRRCSRPPRLPSRNRKRLSSGGEAERLKEVRSEKHPLPFRNYTRL